MFPTFDYNRKKKPRTLLENDTHVQFFTESLPMYLTLIWLSQQDIAVNLNYIFKSPPNFFKITKMPSAISVF